MDPGPQPPIPPGESAGPASPSGHSRFLATFHDHAIRGDGPALTAPLFQDLTQVQRLLAQGVCIHLGLTADDVAFPIERQRDLLRGAGLRRGDDIEVLTGLVRLLIGRPITSAGEAGAIQHAYLHLRRCHWWPSGPEDVPLAALLVTAPGEVDDHARRLERLHLLLSEGDEVPGDPGVLIALYVAVAGLDDAQVLLRFSGLRTDLLLSNIALQDEDIAVLPLLVAVTGGDDGLLRDYLTQRNLCLGQRGSRPIAELIARAADEVVLRRLTGHPQRVLLAVLLIRDWMTSRPSPRRRPVWYVGIRS